MTKIAVWSAFGGMATELPKLLADDVVTQGALLYLDATELELTLTTGEALAQKIADFRADTLAEPNNIRARQAAIHQRKGDVGQRVGAVEQLELLEHDPSTGTTADLAERARPMSERLREAWQRAVGRREVGRRRVGNHAGIVSGTATATACRSPRPSPRRWVASSASPRPAWCAPGASDRSG